MHRNMSLKKKAKSSYKLAHWTQISAAEKRSEQIWN